MNMDCDDTMSGCLVPVDGQSCVNVNLVAPRDVDDRAVVSSRQTDRVAADDLMALASQLTTARDLVKGRACDRLRSIAQQMEQLQVAAKRVLEDAARDEELHTVACNMQKQAGRIYHLYQRMDGHRYFSLLAPHEWGSAEKEGEFVASYRLELDRSWTPIEQTRTRDAQAASFEALLASGKNHPMLNWQ